MSGLRCHWNSTPSTSRIVIWILINLRLSLGHWNKISPFLKQSLITNINQDVIMNIPDCFSIFSRVSFLPNNIGHKILSAKYLIANHLEVMPLIIIDRNPD